MTKRLRSPQPRSWPVSLRLVEIRRVSSEEQALDDRAGLDRQAASNVATAERHGAILIEPPFVLTDVSRTNFRDTPEWRRIVELIAEPDTHIVVDTLDRLAAGLEGIALLQVCRDTGTLVYTSSTVIDLSTTAGRWVAVALSMTAGDELEAIRHRVQGAKEAKRRDGIFPSADIALPTGVAYVRTKGEKKGHWTYNDRIHAVREVFRLVLEEGLRNWSEVARRAGFKNPVTIRNLLKNPIYKGWWIVDRKRQPGPTPIKADGRRKDRKKIKRPPNEIIRRQVFRARGTPPTPEDTREEALLDEATWDALQAIVEAKTKEFYKPREPRGESRFTYSGLLWCAVCGERLWSRTRPRHGRESGRRDWYACASTQVARSACPTKYIDRKRLTAGLDRLFSAVFADDRILGSLVHSGIKGEREDYSERIDAVTQTVTKIEGQRTKLLDLYLSGGWRREDLDARRFKLDAELERAQRTLRQYERAQQAADTSAVLGALTEALQALAEFEFWTAGQKREFLTKFFPKIEVSKKGIERVHMQAPSTRTVGNRAVVVERDEPLVLQVAMTWEQLRPPVEVTEFGLPVKDLYTRADIMTILGLTQHQFNDRIAKGLIPAATKTRWGKRAWTLAQMREIAAAWSERGKPYRWGLAKKPFYASGEVAEILGITWEDLRYAIESGRIADCKGRDGQGHRLWTEAEVERVVGEFGRTEASSHPK